MYIEFVEDHPIGIKKGKALNAPENVAKQWIESDHAIECSEERFNELKEKHYADLEADRKNQAKKTAAHKAKLEKATETVNTVNPSVEEENKPVKKKGGSKGGK